MRELLNRRRTPLLWLHVAKPTLVAAVFSMLALAGCGDQSAAPSKPPTPVQVTTVSPTPRSASVMLTGEIKAHVQSDLGFRISGRIASRSVDVGDRVTAGQALATLDTAEQTADLTSAKAGVQSAEATLTQTSAAFERQKELLAKGFTTQPNFDDAKKAFTVAQASLDSAKANLGTAEDKLDQTMLRADSAGLITERHAEAGQVVQAAQKVFTVARDGGRDAVFDIYEALLATKPADEKIEIVLLSNPSIKTTGKVREIAPVVDASTDTVRVKIGLDDPPPEMTLGAAVAGIGRFQPRDLYVLPWTAFFTDNNKPAVWVVDPTSKVVSLMPVVIASYRTGEILISNGLKPGDMVVTLGVQLLRPGEVVAPREGQAAAEAEGSK